jgi:hypothetical protein
MEEPPTSVWTFARSMAYRGSTRGKLPDARSLGPREEQADKQADRQEEGRREEEEESIDSGRGSSPSSIDGREEQAAGGFPSRESALMREGLTGGKVQKEVGGAFMPSIAARAYSSSLQKGIAGSTFRGMMVAVRAAAAAARRTEAGARVVEEVVAGAEAGAAEPKTSAEDEAAAATANRPEEAATGEGAGEAAGEAATEAEPEEETEAEEAAEEAGFLASLCSFDASRRKREAPKRRKAMVEEERVCKCALEGTSGSPEE